MLTRNFFSLLVMFLAILIFSGSALGSVTFFDGTFNDSDWTTGYEWVEKGTNLLFINQETTGGNPGSYRLFSFEGNGGGAQVIQTLNSAVYNPQTQGAIQALNWSIDTNYNMYYSNKNYSNGGGVFLLVEQNGNYYMQNPGFGGKAGWTTFTLSQYNNSILTGWQYEVTNYGYANPDFSANGAPITFGLFAQFGGACSLDLGIDNYTVQVNPTPIPAAVWLLGSGLAGMGLFRRKVMA